MHMLPINTQQAIHIVKNANKVTPVSHHTVHHYSLQGFAGFQVQLVVQI